MTAVEIRLPELSGGTEAEQLGRIQNYLYTLAQQLQIAFDTISGEQGGFLQETTVAKQETVQETEQPVNFAAIKALILKSAYLTEHFQEAVEKRLTGRYVAQSQFGTYRQETEQRITANSQSIQQKFTNLQQLETTLAELGSMVLEVSATIRTGLLAEEDGHSIYGVEIGQQEWENGVLRFRKYARLTAEKLSFYDSNDVEVAYISDRRLHVTAANVAELTTGSITVQRRLLLGDYLLEQGADGHLSLR